MHQHTYQKGDRVRVSTFHGDQPVLVGGVVVKANSRSVHVRMTGWGIPCVYKYAHDKVQREAK